MRGYTAVETVAAAELAAARLLRAGVGSTISSQAAFMPEDEQGTVPPVTIGAGCRIGPFAVIYGEFPRPDETRIPSARASLGGLMRNQLALNPRARWLSQPTRDTELTLGCLEYGPCRAEFLRRPQRPAIAGRRAPARGHPRFP